MNMKTYRKVLAHQGIGSLMLLGLFSKIAVVTIPVVLNLAVVLGLDRGFGAAGLVITAWTVGVGIGGPLQGRMMDRHGARPVLLASVAAQVLFWGLGPLLPFPVDMVGTSWATRRVARWVNRCRRDGGAGNFRDAARCG